jgi:hypothetical protein
MPNFSRIVTMAYLRILERPPDPGGLANFNQLMNGGLTEAMMREALLRSAEYAQKNPDSSRGAAAKRKGSARRGLRGGKGATRRKTR